jgi:predicted nucleotidyltransferase
MNPLITSKLKSKILAYFFTNPEASCYVRELASILDEDAGNLSRELRDLEGGGMFISDTRGRSKFYSLNKRYPLFNEIKKIIFKTEGIEGSLKQLIAAYRGIDTAFIYGSYAKGKERKASDVDIVVVGELPRDDFTTRLRVLESKLNREINFNLYSSEEFDKERKKTGGFLNMLLKDKVILLKGSLNAR